ncbi:fibronectin-attachment protein (FAP) [Methylobacterium sp. NEAU K]|uniref:fibronectin-attachment protein (FAP) n=1 Tax=Methylobacterium sp. NEAU K TaxID=3064946 RepID=UPI002732B38F|nr:fibronectin-attachment protein (FAP) [Methylobacterium sp. NEAU K]MDP4006847.1 fibronectin-attachment protein (FAP) [Methylobacterium sp. NEAU K]
MSRRNENDSPIETTVPEAHEPRIQGAAEHRETRQPAAFDPSDPNPPAPPTPRPLSDSDAGFGSFG